MKRRREDPEEYRKLAKVQARVAHGLMKAGYPTEAFHASLQFFALVKTAVDLEKKQGKGDL
jgi:hypothetical protein